ncbi:SCO4225 family membrane protein [Streptomyces sp. NPDC055287]
MTFRNPASLAYLGLVAAAAVFVTVDTLFVNHEDASFAGLALLLVSAPTIVGFFAGGDLLGVAVAESDWFLYTALPLSVLIQSFAIAWFARLLGDVSPGRAARPHST